LASKDEERKIEKLLSSYQVRKPPDALMKDYEKEVQEKIKAKGSGPAVGVTVAVGISVALAFVFGVYYFFMMEPAKEKSPVIPAEAGIQTIDSRLRGNDNAEQKPTEVEEETLPERIDQVILDEEALYESMAEDLLLLEMLEEDAGLIDDFEMMEVDLEFLTQLQVV